MIHISNDDIGGRSHGTEFGQDMQGLGSRARLQ